jgi:predicted DCC family thiol-disulfide oxidoreductase YuxK
MMTSVPPASPHVSPPCKPILLYDDECAVCRRMARWVEGAARTKSGESTVVVRAIGEDPKALRRLNPALDIWKVYASSHLLMCDGSIKVGGEAVAEVLRESPGMRWLSWIFAVRVLGRRPFQGLLDIAYVVLSDVRPIFGCKSCGAPALWARPFAWIVKAERRISGKKAHPVHTANFTRRAAADSPKPPAS